MKKLVAMSMIACMAMATVACGSSNSGDTAAAETTETTESTETADAAEDAEAADTADTSEKTWVIAMDTVFRPFEFTDEKQRVRWYRCRYHKAVAEDQGFRSISRVLMGCSSSSSTVRPGRWSDRRSKYH